MTTSSPALAEVQAQMEKVTGPFLPQRRPTDLAVRVAEEVETDGVIRRLLSYQSEDGQWTPAYLLLPRAVAEGEATAPAALALHPTDDTLGHGVVVGLGGRPGRDYGRRVAQAGYVVLAPAYPLLAGYHPDLAALGYSSGTMKAIWDNVRGIDLLESLPGVRPGPVAAVGHSLGGHNGLYTAVFDPRIQAVVTSCGFDSFSDYAGGDLSGWQQERYMPLLGQEHGVPFDFDELLAALAPRTVLVSAPEHDDNFSCASVRRLVGRARRTYAALDADENLVTVHPDCGHDFPPEIQDLALDVLDRVLPVSR
ncbi:alpha/beta hydrolase family protein [Ruania zhangjianzhongii]|uniref:alpha/beta hydrolase family protein n=1 Tax=Ruania zhangjianzhongii TaxID=2603206 RepID=UPI0011CC7E9E|nr:alpha/beta hydrolase [Ruania zhangjianzhongii]